MHLRCPHCQNPIELADLPSGGEISCASCGSSFQLDKFATATFTPPANKRLGKFEILDTVGHGAFGTVLKARDIELDRTVAIKVPRAGNVGPGLDDVDRFLREARAVAQLCFPSIITIHEVGLDNGTPYLVCDFVEGITLADMLTGRGFSFKESAKLLGEVADALQYAHSLGVVHRDVKPSNIMIRPDGSPCVMDFGLAKRDAGEITMTIDGQILGTPAYMSPEQARGDAHKVDGRSDVYSLGVILYQLLTGELPFRGNKAMLLHQVLHEEPQRPRALNDKIPRDLETIALKAMAKEPGRRYASAKEMAEDLRRWLAGEPILARPVGTVERLWRWCKRKPALASLTTALAAVIVIAFAVVTWQLNVTNATLVREGQEKRQRAVAHVNALRDAATGAVPTILAELEANREFIFPYLRERYSQEMELPKRMRLALALVGTEPEKLRDELADWMLQVDDPAEVLLIRDALEPHKKDLLDRFWATAEMPDPGHRSQRLRAAAALAKFDPAGSRWNEVREKVVEDFVAVNPVFLGPWREAFRPVKVRLLPPLSDIFRDQRPERIAERKLATSLLADYAADQPHDLAELLMDADDKQFAIIFPKFKEQSIRGLPVLTAEIDKKLPIDLPSSDVSREKLAKRQANAAIALFRLKQEEKIWPLLKRSLGPDDPRVRSYLIQGLFPKKGHWKRFWIE